MIPVEIKSAAESLLQRIATSTSPVFTVLTAERQLQEAGFFELPLSGDWNTPIAAALDSETPAAFYTKVYDSSLFAFILPPNADLTPGGHFRLRIASAHTDSPCFAIKPTPDMTASGCHKLNIEGYGGMIKNAWLDRPLSLSGKALIRSWDPFHPEVRYLDFRRPLLTIPNLAIHMNREVNEGKNYNTQIDMLPVTDAVTEALRSSLEENDTFLKLLSSELSVAPEDILSYDFRLYPFEKGCILGFDESLISAPRIDNLTSVDSCINALIHTYKSASCETGMSDMADLPDDAAEDTLSLHQINEGTEESLPPVLDVIALFDHEEVGSHTKQGAASRILSLYLEKLYDALGFSRRELFDDMADGLMFSLDVAHAAHPNIPQKSDPTNQVRMNGGVTLKLASSQRYASDAEGVAIAKELCHLAGVPCQEFVNRSDERGGSTLGAISSTLLPMRTVDMGIAILAMHSARELAGVYDPWYMQKLIERFMSAE